VIGIQLPEDQVFPFFELRAAAQDLRDGLEFDPDNARRRIAAHLNTLRDHQADFAVIAFAIFAPGYGPDNYTPFAEAFGSGGQV